MENIDYRIDNTERTGYPEPVDVHNYLACCICGENIYSGDDYYDFAGDIVCEEHEVEYILENCKKVAQYGM